MMRPPFAGVWRIGILWVVALSGYELEGRADHEIAAHGG